MKKILIADDSMFMRKMLKDILSGKYRTVEAGSGKETKEQFKNEKPDLTLLDIIMPEGEEEGIGVLREIIKSDPKARVMMITAVGQDAIVDECKNLGAADFIVKPFDAKLVAAKVQKYLG